MLKYIFYLLVSFITISCVRFPADVETALVLADDNRAELELVMEHYRSDRLKYKAACFLISNIPYHYTVHDEQLEAFKAYLSRRSTRARLLAFYERTFGPVSGNKQIKHDLYHITSEYLIRNIDFSFKVWQETPWRKSVSFEKFCEELLPYRLSNEPLEDWKEAYYKTFRHMVDTMSQNHDPAIVCQKLMNHINQQQWIFESGLETQGFGALIMLSKRFGNCKEQAEFITYVMRSLGIPSGIDIIVQNPDNANRVHYWNYIRNMEGKTISFDYYEMQLKQRIQKRKYGKIYRQNFPRRGLYRQIRECSGTA